MPRRKKEEEKAEPKKTVKPSPYGWEAVRNKAKFTNTKNKV